MKSTFVVGAVALSISVSAADAATSVYSSGHGDIGIAYEGGEFEPHWHIGAGATVDGSPLASEGEYEPAGMVAEVTSTRNSPIGLASAIGLPDGSFIYTAGSATYQPNLGFATEELNADNWNGNLTITLTGWSTPGGAEAALYTTNLAGTSVADVAFSTYNAGSTAFGNSLSLAPESHTHLEWAFTELGSYSFTFEWVGDHVTDGIVTDSATFSFQVVPEPAQAGLVLSLIGVAAVFISRRPSLRASVC
tara:strand:- start:13253 stop:13999 length:747 start_codon:yes stop_codon:yes gene_type:complete